MTSQELDELEAEIFGDARLEWEDPRLRELADRAILPAGSTPAVEAVNLPALAS